MNTYHKLIQCLNIAAERAGGKAKLYKMLDTSKPTFYKAMSETDPILPATKVLCRWCDALNIDIFMPGQERHDYIAIPKISKYQLDNIKSAEEKEERIFFHRNWFEKRKINPSNCVISSDFELGDYIKNTDDVLIDTSKNTFEDGGIFAVAINDGDVLLRRCQYIPGAMRIWSDGSHPFYVVDGENTDTIHIYGRMLWTGRAVV